MKRDQIVVTGLSLGLIKQLVEEAREGRTDRLKEIIRDGFSDPYVLNSSFLKRLDTATEEDITVVDLQAARITYRLILNLERAPLLHTLENATDLVVSRLTLKKQPITSAKDMRQIMILFENPLVLYGEKYGSVSSLRKLLQSIFGLPPQLQATLVKWFAVYSTERFAELIKIIQAFVNMHIYQQHYPKTYDSTLHHGISFLRLLYEANQIENKVTYTSFYNDALFDKVNIKEDYRRWMLSRHPEKVKKRKKDLFGDTESSPPKPSDGNGPESRKEMVADDAVDERVIKHFTWVAEDFEGPSQVSELADPGASEEESGRPGVHDKQPLQAGRSETDDEETLSTEEVRTRRLEKGKEKMTQEDDDDHDNEEGNDESQEDGHDVNESKDPVRAPEEGADEEAVCQAAEEHAGKQGEGNEGAQSENFRTAAVTEERRKKKEPNFLARERENEKSMLIFCDYPFLLGPATKARIVHIDAAMQMSYEVEDAIAKLSFLGMLKEQSLPLLIPASVQRTAVPHLVLEIRRQELIEDTLAQISARLRDLKKPLKVKFVGEDGIDQGGVQKEFFQLFVEEIFDPKYGMFSYDEETRQVWFNPFSLENENQYQLVGMILGLAIYNGVILDLHLPLVVYKKLLGQKPTFEDLKGLRPTMARGLQQLLDYNGDDVEDTFCLTFQTDHEMFGERVVYDLKPGGESIPVTNANRKEYVDLYIKYLLDDSIAFQFNAFALGFHTVCGGPVLQLFRGEELEQLICGSGNVNFNELERIALYSEGYNPQHPTIKAFWEIFHELSLEQQKYLLAFVTGSDRVPIKGISRLTFIIQRNGPDTNRLPTSFTCFSRLLLPEYSSKEKLRKMLIMALDNFRGFGLC